MNKGQNDDTLKLLAAKIKKRLRPPQIKNYSKWYKKKTQPQSDTFLRMIIMISKSKRTRKRGAKYKEHIALIEKLKTSLRI